MPLHPARRGRLSHALNAYTLAVRPALDRRWADALAAFDATGEVGVLGTDTRGDAVEGLSALLQQGGVDPQAWYGVWLFTDWLDLSLDGTDVAAVAAVELEASVRHPYRQQPGISPDRPRPDRKHLTRQAPFPRRPFSGTRLRPGVVRLLGRRQHTSELALPVGASRYLWRFYANQALEVVTSLPRPTGRYRTLLPGSARSTWRLAASSPRGREDARWIG